MTKVLARGLMWLAFSLHLSTSASGKFKCLRTTRGALLLQNFLAGAGGGSLIDEPVRVKFITHGIIGMKFPS